MQKFDLSKVFELNKDELLKRVSNIEILQYYIPGNSLKYVTLCKLHNDSNPSLHVDLNRGTFCCFSCNKVGDGITYVMERFRVTFNEALKIIAVDFNLINQSVKYKIPMEVALGVFVKRDFQNKADIKIKSREWLQKDILYWKQFNVSKELAVKYNIYPISHYWVNNFMFTIKLGELAYAFLEQDKFQIYQPYVDKSKKWFSNTGSMIYGFDQLPPFGELLFITSSKKDILTLTSLGYNAVSPNNEGSKLPVEKYEDLNNRFDKIVIFFNNDQQGLKAAHYMSQDLGLDFVYIPLEYNETDPSDYCKSYGESKTRELIKQLL